MGKDSSEGCGGELWVREVERLRVVVAEAGKDILLGLTTGVGVVSRLGRDADMLLARERMVPWDQLRE
jgi:hypothetical protein